MSSVDRVSFVLVRDVTHWFVDNCFDALWLAIWFFWIQKWPYLGKSLELVGDVVQVFD